ncbi:hypothetical protein BN137_2462 [Cronobacter condimenti 1330]|uniref:Uncharacterized protein n=1 Tax=Cronobacter condimenti 1330 TaxID=1073999 RepID=K8A145_9ENTR|nr:hypothetical protein BN137_2462 [Cronobacter condimenti 1330]
MASPAGLWLLLCNSQRAPVTGGALAAHSVAGVPAFRYGP